MPTYCHKETGTRFLYVHIPRTAGRFLEENILNNGFECEQQHIWKSESGVEVAHFHKELYEKKFDCDSIPHVAIVRDPVDRFFSASIFLTRMYGDDIEPLLENENTFYSLIENFPLSEAVNWFRPQVDFIGKDTHVWKYEDGIGKDFSKWISSILGFEFKIEKLKYSKLTTDETNKVKRTSRIIKNVKDLYSKDYNLLYQNK